jgi:lipopolysaccharide cholinephosphotransferase
VAQVREHQLRLLEVIAHHCDAHGLRYYLYAGTLLGAVRHKGYIPWDDDIDLMLPRPDYEALCAGFPGADTPDGISLRSRRTDDGYVLPFAKVCNDPTRLEVESDIIHGLGINVDVFPLDGWMEGWRRRLQTLLLGGLIQIMRAKNLKLSRKRSLLRTSVLATVKTLLATLPAGRVSGWLERVGRWGDYETSREAGVLVWGTLEAFPVEAFGSPTSLDFEGKRYSGPEDPDTILGIHYGHYMLLPPVEARVTNHRLVAYEL